LALENDLPYWKPRQRLQLRRQKIIETARRKTANENECNVIAAEGASFFLKPRGEWNGIDLMSQTLSTREIISQVISG
jgi:hypothetical protein